MSMEPVPDPFNLLGAEFEEPQSFDAAAREALVTLTDAAARFEALMESVPLDRLTDSEWRVVELAGADLEAAVERAEEGFVAVQYDSHAWYHILENLHEVRNRLNSAAGILESTLQGPTN